MRTSHKFTHNLSDAEIRSIFLDSMKAAGLIFEPKDIPVIMDGKTRYVRVSNRSRNKIHHRSGWYVGHLGDFPAGKFGWMHGDQSEFSWSLYKHLKESGQSITYVEITPEQLAALKLKDERDIKRRIREEKERFEFSKALTIIEWHRSLPLRNHPYLTSKRFSIAECEDTARLYNRTDFTAKQAESILLEHYPEFIKPSNIRKLINYQTENITFRGFNIIIKGETIENEPLMFQLLFDKKNKAGKNKHFPKSQIKSQTFCRLGPEINSETAEVYICEGWATAISLRRITCNKSTILVAWDSGNMKAVAMAIRKKYGKCRINCAIDNDHTKPDAKNAGIIGGLKICHAVGAFLVKPPFESNNPLHEPLSDWNDIDMLYPPQETCRLFYEALTEAKFISAVFEENQLLTTPGEYINFDEYPDELFLSNDFAVTWATIVPLVELGLQHCQHTADEQKEMFLASREQTIVDFKNNGWDKLKRIYAANIDIKISQLIFVFTNALLQNPKPITASHELFTPVLKQLQGMQDYLIDTNPLIAVCNAVGGLYGEDLAKACLPQYLVKADYFRRSQAHWQRAVLNQVATIMSGAGLAVITPLLLTCREADFWEYNSARDREMAAATQIIRVYEEFLLEAPLIEAEAEQCQDQITKLNYITGAVSKCEINNDDKNAEFLQRIIQRFNETERFPYPVSS